VRRLLLVKAGNVAAPVAVAFGDYDRWFLRAIGPARCRLRVVAAHLGEPLPARARGFDAVIVTGSPRSVTEREPWMLRAGAWLVEAAEQRVPVLGVCFGHQLLAEALGGRVRRSPAGREIGTVACALTPAGRADPLFEGVPAALDVQATHEDEVAETPPGLEVLASNAASRVQAFRVGGCLRGVQFHPELDAATLRAIAVARTSLLEREARERGDDPKGRVRAVLGGIRETPFARRTLENFVERFT
jgi:GMP synthase (glutamine-hydrolysing)